MPGTNFYAITTLNAPFLNNLSLSIADFNCLNRTIANTGIALPASFFDGLHNIPHGTAYLLS